MSDLDPQDPTSNEPTSEVASFAAAPTPQGRGRRAGRAALWIAVGAVGATAVTGVAFAASNSDSTPSPSPSAPAGAPAPGEGAPGGGPGGPGGFGGHRGGHGFGGELGFGAGDVLHGEFVVKDGTATKTLLGQQGDVTAASSTSLTVKSSDGFTATWTLDSSTKVLAFAAKGKTSSVSDLKTGQTVTVIGTKSSDTSGTATSVRIRPTQAQLDELKKNAPQGWGDHQRPGKQAAPAPTASPTAAA